jgi:pseudouridine-5'-phosphate glycosidase
MAEAEKVKAVVARGRTIIVDGKPVVHPNTVMLDQDEEENLRKRGFLASTDALPAPAGAGPKILTGEGPKIRAA